MIKKILALAKKDLFCETSYRLAFFLPLIGVLVSLLTFYFIDRMFGQRMTPHLEEFRVRYFPYVLVSMALFSYIGVGIHSFAGRLRAEQTQGTLEALLATPTPLPVLLAGMGLSNLIVATLHAAVYFVFGAFLFGIDFSAANLPAALTILLLTILSFSGLGILSASVIMVFKKGNPVEWILNSLEGLVGGVYFPVSVLPGVLQVVSRFLPITYAVRGMELAVFRGYSLLQLKTEIGALCLFTVFFLPLSLWTFRSSLDRARREGTLSQY